MLNSSSSIIPSFREPDTILSNTTSARVTMSINCITFLSFCWYFLVSTKIIPLAIAPVRDAALNGMLTGTPMNVANVATLDIPVAMLIPLEQVFNHVSRFNILLYFLYLFLNIASLSINPHLLTWTTFRWYATGDPRGAPFCRGGTSGGGPGTCAPSGSWAPILRANRRIGYVL